MSRDAVKLLEGQDDVRGIFNHKGSDFLARFPGLLTGVSFENLFKAYERFVSVTIDEDSGIATLQAKAFTPADSQRLAERLIHYSELLVNRMNARAEQDAVSLAHQEVDRAEGRVVEARAALTSFRNHSMMIDPSVSSNHMLLLISRLSGDVALREARLADLEQTAPGSPQIAVLKSEIAALQSQITSLNGKLAGGTQSMSPQLATFEQLQLKRDFADKEFAGAMDALETARIDAERQHIYLERVVDPMLPDYALYPKRLKAVALVFGSTLMVFALGWLLVTGAREHIS